MVKKRKGAKNENKANEASALDITSSTSVVEEKATKWGLTASEYLVKSSIYTILSTGFFGTIWPTKNFLVKTLDATFTDLNWAKNPTQIYIGFYTSVVMAGITGYFMGRAANEELFKVIEETKGQIEKRVLSDTPDQETNTDISTDIKEQNNTKTNKAKEFIRLLGGVYS